MKALAARTRDIDDLRLLADIVGVESADEALRMCADFYPDEPVSPRSAAVLRELFGWSPRAWKLPASWSMKVAMRSHITSSIFTQLVA
jgi:hypothetical protein